MAEEDYGGIHERVIGKFPLSIATSLAIESLCGIHPDIPTPSVIPLKTTQNLWINLRTLYRNFMGSLPKGMAGAIRVDEIVHGLLEEMNVIPDILREFQGRPVTVEYYFSNYKGLEQQYPHAIIRQDTTVKQAVQTDMLKAVMEIMVKHFSNQFKLFDLKLRGDPRAQVTILTHYAFDLLSYPAFAKLTLLESHTGRFKDRAQWYTKYQNGSKDCAMIPFREDFIQVFGDAETFHPMDIKLRKALIEVATKRMWSSVTTRERIVQGIADLENPLYKVTLLALLV